MKAVRPVRRPLLSLLSFSFFARLRPRKPSRFLTLRVAFFVPAVLLVVTFLAFPILQTAYLGFIFHPRVGVTFGENPGNVVMGVTEDAGVRVADPDVNFDAGSDQGGRFAVDNSSHLWFRFDISAIPPLASIESATLYLFSGAHEGTGERKRLEMAGVNNTTAANGWVDSLATWNTYDGSAPWSGGGDGGEADRNVTFRIMSLDPTDGDGYYAFEFSPDGRSYLEERIGGPVSLQVYGANIGHDRQFVVSEGAEGERPFLEVIYEEAGEAIGFQNYADILTSKDTINLDQAPFPPLGTLLHNFIWIAIHLPVTLFAGLFLAIILRDMRGASVIKGIVFLGMVTPLVIGGLILRFLFTQDSGIVPAFFAAIGFEQVTILGREICLACTWTIQPETLLVGLIFGSVWLWTGFSLIVYSAGLTTIPRDYFEAAKMDGASPFQIFRRITFPLLKPITLVVITMTVLYELKIFDIVISATNPQGGVAAAGDVLALQMYRLGFVATPFEPNLAAVVATLLTLLTLFATVWTIRYLATSGATRPLLRPAVARVWRGIRTVFRR